MAQQPANQVKSELFKMSDHWPDDWGRVHVLTGRCCWLTFTELLNNKFAAFQISLVYLMESSIIVLQYVSMTVKFKEGLNACLYCADIQINNKILTLFYYMSLNESNTECYKH